MVAALISVGAVLVSTSKPKSVKRQAEAAERQTAVQERMQQDAAQPYVHADSRVHPQEGVLLMLVITNSGPTVATNVDVRFAPFASGLTVFRG